MRQHTINVRGKLFSLNPAAVMGIVNLTPDSFYSESRKNDEESLRDRIRQIVEEGGNIIDIGACSSRPDAPIVSQEEEMKRLRNGLQIILKTGCNLPLSVDTFRADVAKMCVEEYGVAIINDISSGQMDKNMFQTIAQMQVPYIMMHMRGTPETMQQQTKYNDLVAEMFLYFSVRINQLRELGVNDIIIDPGFGFAKTTEQNYELLNRLEDFQEFDLPILVGVSRKSMIYKHLGITPQDALNGTTVINTIALTKGAEILRVHDIKPCVEAVRIYDKLKENAIL